MFNNHRLDLARWLALVFMPLISAAFGAAIYVWFFVLGQDVKVFFCLPAVVMYWTGTALGLDWIYRSIPPVEKDPPHIIPDFHPMVRNYNSTVKLYAYETEDHAIVSRLPCEWYQYDRLFTGLYNNGRFGVPLTVRRWCRKEGEVLFTDTEFKKLQDAMVKAALASRRGRGQKSGVELNGYGRSVIRADRLSRPTH